MKILCSLPNRPCPPVNLHAHLQEGWHRWHQGKMHGLILLFLRACLVFSTFDHVNLVFLGYRNGPERNASQVLSWQNRTCVQCNSACCWHHCQQAGQVSGIVWFFKLFIIAINFLTWHPFASLALKPLVGGVWPPSSLCHQGCLCREWSFMWGKAFHPWTPQSNASLFWVCYEETALWILKCFYNKTAHLFCQRFINVCV